VALFPLVPSVTTVEEEYLETYPRVELLRFQDTKFHYCVIDPRDEKYWCLGAWLKEEVR